MKNQEIQIKVTRSKIVLAIAILATAILATAILATAITSKKITKQWATFVIEGNLLQIQGDMYEDRQCSKRVRTDVAKTWKFGRRIKVEDQGLKYEVIEVVWSIKGQNKLVYFRTYE